MPHPFKTIAGFFLLAALSVTTAHAQETCKTANGFVDTVLTTSATKDLYSSALIMGHITQSGDDYLCVNGLKITSDTTTRLQNGNIPLHHLSDFPARAYVEIRATPNTENNEMLARDITLQYTVAGSMKLSSTVYQMDILGENILFDAPFSPDLIDFSSSFVVNGLRHPERNNAIIPLLVRYGDLKHNGYGRTTRVTGLLRREEKTDNFGNKTHKFFVGNTAIVASDESLLKPYIDKHICLRGVWTKGIYFSYLDFEALEETPWTAVYAPVNDPTYLSLEYFTAEKEGTFFVYNLPVDTAPAQEFKSGYTDKQKSEHVVIATGRMAKDEPAHITFLKESSLPAPLISHIETRSP